MIHIDLGILLLLLAQAFGFLWSSVKKTEEEERGVYISFSLFELILEKWNEVSDTDEVSSRSTPVFNIPTTSWSQVSSSI